MMAVVLSKDARARAVQLPAWNEALGLPRPKNCKEVFITNSLFGIRPVEKIEKFNFNIGQDTYDIDKFLSNLGM